MLFQVTETQTVQYSWTVEADTEAEAEATALEGIPDDAFSTIRSAETEAGRIGESYGPVALVLPRWEVTYRIVSAVDSPPSLLAEGKTTVRALTEETARDLVAEILGETTYHAPRLKPRIVIVSATLVPMSPELVRVIDEATELGLIE